MAGANPFILAILVIIFILGEVSDDPQSVKVQQCTAVTLHGIYIFRAESLPLTGGYLTGRYEHRQIMANIYTVTVHQCNIYE